MEKYEGLLFSDLRIAGDILLTRVNANANGVAPNDHFNNGLDFALREQCNLSRVSDHY